MSVRREGNARRPARGGYQYREGRPKPNPVLSILRRGVRRAVMDDAIFIYRNRSEERFYDANTQRMQGGPDKVIVYINGVLCAMDHEARIIIPVSRWKLAEIGWAC